MKKLLVLYLIKETFEVFQIHILFCQTTQKFRTEIRSYPLLFFTRVFLVWFLRNNLALMSKTRHTQKFTDFYPIKT